MALQESDFAANIERFTGQAYAELYDRYRPHPPTALLDLLTQSAKVITPHVESR